MAIIISIGKYGGFYFYRGAGLRLCLGWVAVTIIMEDGDDVLELAAVGGKYLLDKYGKDGE